MSTCLITTDSLRLYNCSLYDVENVPLAERRNLIVGAIYLALFFILETLYIPCLFAMTKRLDQSAYKIMFFMGISDISCLPILGLLQGFLGITGGVYCSYPNLIYIAGFFSMFFWACEGCTATILAFNRCLEISLPKLCDRLFHGRKTWFWLCFPLIYGFFFATFFEPVLFSPIFMAWFLNPHMGYLPDPDHKFHNNAHIINNSYIFLVLTSLYFTFTILLYLKTKSHTKGGDAGAANLLKSQRMSFLQVMVLSIVHMFASGLYCYMQYFDVGEVLIMVAMFSWFLAHGLPPVVYLLLNKSLQKDCILMCKRLLGIEPQSKSMVSGINVKMSSSPVISRIQQI